MWEPTFAARLFPVEIRVSLFSKIIKLNRTAFKELHEIFSTSWRAHSTAYKYNPPWALSHTAKKRKGELIWILRAYAKQSALFSLGLLCVWGYPNARQNFDLTPSRLDDAIEVAMQSTNEPWEDKYIPRCSDPLVSKSLSQAIIGQVWRIRVCLLAMARYAYSLARLL